ncbi:MAG TPA: MraY family glycosyltransferase [Chitinophagaceae bacterium]|nr:MraY family glycosyltransferase [Chitinophagaceae bacterium]
MRSHIHHLLQINLHFQDYKFALLCFVTAFVVTLLTIPPIVSLIKRYKLYDMPNSRKEHSSPVPTMGGIAIVAGMITALLFWFPFDNEPGQVCFFFSIAALFGLGIMDDLKDLSAKYKFVIQIALASLIALSGIRITSFDGLFGITDLPLSAQYSFTILAIVGITNAFNLIDGIDGLAGGLAFMSLVTVGLILTMSGDANTALVAFALAGAVFAFLYFNFNPAKIFMGDTGSLILGFVIAVLCVRLMQINISAVNPVIVHAPMFVLGIVLIPVFDTLRVFALRIWKGGSPFDADKTHIHHLLTNQGFTHVFAVRVIYFIHAFILIEVYLLQAIKQEFILLFLVAFMLFVTIMLRNMRVFVRKPDKVNPASYSDRHLS